MLNITNIPAPRVSIIDEKTGLISREWYRFFLNLFTLVGQGNNQTSLDDLQVGPPAQNINILVAGSATDLAPPAVTPMSVADNQALLPPFAQQSFDDSQAVSPPFVVPSADDSQALLPAAMQIFIDSYANLSPPIIPPGPTSSGTVTSVDVSGGTTGMTFTGGPITSSGTITMSGTLAVANGGTGSTTLDGAGIVTKTGTQTISGQKNFTSYTNTFLGTTYATSDGGTGSNAYFGENSAYAVVGGANGVVLASGATYPGTSRYVGDATSFRPSTTASYSSGTLTQRWTTVYSQNLDLSGVVAAGTWNGSTITVGYGGTGVTSTPSNGQLLIGNGSGYSLATLTAGSNISISNGAGSITISASGSTGVSSVDVSGGTTGLTTSGGPITSSGTITLGGTLNVANGGTGLTSTPSNGQLDIGNGSGFTRTTLTAGTGVSISNGSGSITINATNNGTVTSVDGSGGSTGLTLTGGPITTSGTLTLGGTLAVANGGTGASSLTGAGIVTTTGTQTISGQKNFTSYTNTFLATTYATSNGSSSSNAYFGESGAYAVLGGANGVVLASGATYPGSSIFAGDSGTWRSTTDNVRALGTGLFRYTVVYATTGTINTSDANQKQQIRDLSDAEQRTAQRVKKLIRAFKWNDAVEAKGDEARIHFGVIAQEVQEAFAAEGLDASKYGLFCSDTWTTSDGSSQTRLGVRYSELLAFIIAAL
jgi:hypothetical protein